METLTLATADGATLAADIAPATAPPRGVAVLCHPHPAYGGNRFNPVVERLFAALPGDGWSTMRFDFRLPPDDDRLPEIAAADLAAALDWADEQAGDRADGEIAVVGYSYGAVAALRSDDRRIARIAAITPPLSVLTVGRKPTVPTLLITAAHDQFTPTQAAGALTESWNEVTRVDLPSADHFLGGHTGTVTELVTDWLGGRHAP